MKMKKPLLILILIMASAGISVQGQESLSVLYVPLIGITSVPEPFALPAGAGPVTYNYAVKNFLHEVSLNDIEISDSNCAPIEFVEGDDDNDAKLDDDETWRYTCLAELTQTTSSVAVVTGQASGITATHKTYTTVVVGSANPPPLVSIINITKVAYPLSLPREGGRITFTYKVNNPGIVPLSEVIVSDDKCAALSGKLGDTNGNNLLDPDEVWIYTCPTILKQTTTNTVTVAASANGLRATGEATLTVRVEPRDDAVPGFPTQPLPSQDVPEVPQVPNFPETGLYPSPKTIVWTVLSSTLATLLVTFLALRYQKNKLAKKL